MDSPVRAAGARRVRGAALAAVWAVGSILLGACLVENSTPSLVHLRISGVAGTEIQLVVSREFVAGVDQLQVTQVQLFQADTILTSLPVDTVVSISTAHRFFAEATPVQPDTLDVTVRVDVDERRLYDRRGLVWQDVPFRFVYVFNQALTQTIDIVL